SLAWCARSSALICARRRSTGTGSIASSSVTAPGPTNAPRAVAQLEPTMPRVLIDPALPDRASLDNEIARMRGLDVGQLRARWQTVFRRKAPPKKNLGPTKGNSRHAPKYREFHRFWRITDAASADSVHILNGFAAFSRAL